MISKEEYQKKYCQKNKKKRQEYWRRYHQIHKIQLMQYQREYQQKNKKKILEQHRKYYQSNKERILLRTRKWRKENTMKCKEISKKSNWKLKIEVLTHYGGNPPKCACCGETEIKFLSIDHMNNDGAEHKRKINKKGGSSFYCWLRKNGFPKGYQILCFNCNSAKFYFGKCPHQE